MGLYGKTIRLDGTPVDTSAHYLDTMVLTDYWNEVALHDAGAKSGIASFSFDLRGNKFVTLEIESIGTNGGKLGFEAEGY